MRPSRRAVAVFLVGWSVGFAAFHVGWACGWRFGIPHDVAPIGTRPVFLTYDIVAAVLMVGAAVVAVVLGFTDRPRGRRRHQLVVITVVASVAALLRGTALVIDVVTGDFTGVGPAADLWFVVSGVAGLLLARACRDGSGEDPAQPVRATIVE